MQVRLSKFIAVMLVVIILGSISLPVVSYSAELFLSENELESQNTTSKMEVSILMCNMKMASMAQ